MKLPTDRGPLYLAMAVAGAAAVTASATTLAHLAEVASWITWTKWLLPAALDVGTAGAVWCWLRPSFPRPARNFARTVALAGALGTLAGNAAGHLLESGYLHAGPALVVTVGAVPAAMLVALGHLTALLVAEPAPPPAPTQSLAVRTDSIGSTPTVSVPVESSTPSSTGTAKPVTPTGTKSRPADPPSAKTVDPAGGDPQAPAGSTRQADPTRSSSPPGSGGADRPAYLSDRGATRAGSGSTDPDVIDSPNAESGSGLTLPDDWERPKGDDEKLLGAIRFVLAEEWATCPLSEAHVLKMVAVGGQRARSLRDIINNEFRTAMAESGEQIS